MLYGNFMEVEQNIIMMQEDISTGLRAFVHWAYTGVFGTCFTKRVNANGKEEHGDAIVASLWILADKLGASKFGNDAFMELFEISGQEDFYIDPSTIEYVYTNTLPSAKLRTVVKDLVVAYGPFSEEREASDELKKKWLDLLAKGGDFVVDVTQSGELHAYEGIDIPVDHKDQLKYIEVNKLSAH
ncbi:hypothetical protein G7Y89_g2080 [Cudoniella acicularis]|uniref:Uncharacterized protein n=1 Tax=Cudoniella acicularis TaxID=354080 RepID=A0A8H4RV40_9HELO|nr:hypothetical protein G7Y89_g2080 [Cudoniella acicularis]